VSAVATRPRLGFLGVGWIGRLRLEAVAASGEADVAAVADPAVPGALASLDELLAEELDGVVIATPSALHAEQALAALERGLPVFCQKPLALDATSAAGVVDAARRSDALLAVDFCYRETAAARAVRELVRSGAIGDVYAVDLVFHNAYGPDKPWSRDPALSGGGCTIDLGIHLLDLAHWILGPLRVRRLAATLRSAPPEDFCAAQLELDGAAVLRLACSWRLHAGRDCVFEATFYGTDGAASMRNAGGSFYDFVAERNDATQTQTLVSPPDDWGGRAVLAWARRVAAGEGFDATADDYVAVHELVDRIYGEQR
jgi:predicted dehydrogenase